MATDRIYDFTQDAGGTGYRLTSLSASVNVSHVNAGPITRQSASSRGVSTVDLWPGVDVVQTFETYAVSSRFTLHRNRELKLKFEVSEGVSPREESPGIVSFVDDGGRTTFALLVGNPADDTGMAGPKPSVDLSGSGRHWVAGIVIDDRWVTDEARVSPLTLDVTISMTSVYALARTMDRVSAAASSQRRVYWDPRADAATQFAVEFFDDAGFTRPRPLKDGVPVCSTVPYGVPSTSGMTSDEITSWDEGVGNPTRTMHLQIIASKEVAPNKTVYYDVEMPGTIDYLHNVAQPAGYLGPLPIYRGSFEVAVEAPPSFLDGDGAVRAYMVESRTRLLYARMSVIGRGESTIPGSKLTVGNAGSAGTAIWNVGCRVAVHELGRSLTRGRVTVLPRMSATPPTRLGTSLWNIGGRVAVIVVPTAEFYTDDTSSGWDFSSTLYANHSVDAEYDTTQSYWPYGGTSPTHSSIAQPTAAMTAAVATKNASNLWYAVFTDRDYPDTPGRGDDNWIRGEGGVWVQGVGVQTPVLTHVGSMFAKNLSTACPVAAASGVIAQIGVLNEWLGRTPPADVEAYSEASVDIPTAVHLKLKFGMTVDGTLRDVHYSQVIRPQTNGQWTNVKVILKPADSWVPAISDTLVGHTVTDVELWQVRIEMQPAFTEWHKLGHDNPRCTSLLTGGNWWTADLPGWYRGDGRTWASLASRLRLSYLRLSHI